MANYLQIEIGTDTIESIRVLKRTRYKVIMPVIADEWSSFIVLMLDPNITDLEDSIIAKWNWQKSGNLLPDYLQASLTAVDNEITLPFAQALTDTLDVGWYNMLIKYKTIEGIKDEFPIAINAVNVIETPAKDLDTE